ncbi:MAG: glycosyltransferase involved in cell wall biosynthesis [Myxococcota bacterium]|jgi:glycosyltransferase involved in cell wall biosynthesis
MRIAFVTPEFVSEPRFDGGLANYLLRVTRMLNGLGHEPHVIVASDRDEDLVFEGVAVHRVDVQSGVVTRLVRKLLRSRASIALIPWQSFRLNQRVRALHRARQFDVAHYASYTATALFRPSSIPCVVRLSSLESLWSDAYERGKASKGVTRATSWLETHALLRADQLICPSVHLARTASERIDRPVEVVESPYLPPTDPLDDRIYQKHLAGKRYGMFFGTIGLLKGVKTLAEALPELFSAEKDLFFVFVGKQTSDAGRPMLETVFAHVGADAKRVLHFEPMSHAELYPIIDGASVVVLPSRVDNFPNTCLEAMSRGKLVVGTRGASFEQLIDDGASGYLCEIDDRKSLLAAMKRALACESPDEVGERAKARIARLGAEGVGRDLVRVYEATIARKGGIK